MRKLALLIAATLATAIVVGGVLALQGPAPEEDGGAAPEAEPRHTPTPLAGVDTAALVVARDGFCDRVPVEAVADALGAEPATADAYANGERAVLADGLADVAHEFGCVWTARGAEARAWVFAPPVSLDDARGLRRAADRMPRCRPIDGAAAFGEPATALVCGTPDGPVASYRGLFGDAWLACSVRGTTREDSAARADRWCAAVALAASS